MSDNNSNNNIFNFDDDDIFDESYNKSNQASPVRKEFEIEIPIPASSLKSTFPQQNEEIKPVRPSQKNTQRKKLSKTALSLSIIGIVFTTVIVFVAFTLLTILNWKHLPDFNGQKQEDSIVNDIEKNTDTIESESGGGEVVLQSIPSSDGAYETPVISPEDITDSPSESGDESDEEKSESESESESEGKTEAEDESESEEIVTIID